MSARSTTVQLVTKATVGIGALFLVSVLLAAMPGHHAPTVGSAESGSDTPSRPRPSPEADHASMPGMKMSGDEKSSEAPRSKI